MDPKRKLDMIETAKTILETKKDIGKPQSKIGRTARIEIYKQECAEFFLNFGDEQVSLLEAQRAQERARTTEH